MSESGITDGRWNTADECLFIDGIGRGKGERPSNRPLTSSHLFWMSRQEMLRMYLAYCGARYDWEHMDSGAVIAHARAAVSVL